MGAIFHHGQPEDHQAIDRIRIGDRFESILAAARSGEEWAWSEIYGAIAGPVTGFFRISGAEEPEVAAGDVFFELARSISQFDGDESDFRTLVFLIAYRRKSEIGKSLLRRRSVLSDDVLVALQSGRHSEFVSTERVSQLEKALEALEPSQRDLLALRVVGGLSLKEAANVMGRRFNSIRALQRKAMHRMRYAVSPEGVPL